MEQRDRDLADLLDRVSGAGEGDRIKLGDAVETVGRDGALPIVLIVAVVGATPLSGIPGVSVACGLIIALTSTQYLFGRKGLWLPERLGNLSLARDRAERTIRRIWPVVHWFDQHTHERLGVLVRPPLVVLPEILMVLAGLSMPFLEIVPFSSTAMAMGVACLSLSLLTRDGLLCVVAIIPFATLASLVWLAFR